MVTRPDAVLAGTVFTSARNLADAPPRGSMIVSKSSGVAIDAPGPFK
jgi:hypothetical protein